MKKLAVILSFLFCQNIFAAVIELKWRIQDTRVDGEPFSISEVDNIEVYHANTKGAELGDYDLETTIDGTSFVYQKEYESGEHCFVLVLRSIDQQKSGMSNEKCFVIKSKPLPPTDIQITFTTTVRIIINQ